MHKSFSLKYNYFLKSQICPKKRQHKKRRILFMVSKLYRQFLNILPQHITVQLHIFWLPIFCIFSNGKYAAQNRKNSEKKYGNNLKIFFFIFRALSSKTNFFNF